MELSKETQKKETHHLVKEEAVSDPDVAKVLQEFERQLIQREIGKAMLNKKKTDQGEEDRKQNVKQTFIRFMFTKVETNIAKRHANTDPEPCLILDGLFIGSIGSAVNKQNLRKAGITHIVTCLDFAFMPFTGEFEYLHVPVLDSPTASIDQFFDNAHAFYETARQVNGKVFVHCFAGLSRSTTVACAIVMKSLAVDRMTALDRVRLNRPQVRPNQGFWSKLQQWEKKSGLKDKEAAKSIE